MCDKILTKISNLYPFSKNISKKMHTFGNWLITTVIVIILLSKKEYSLLCIKVYLFSIIITIPITLNVYLRENLSNKMSLLMCLTIVFIFIGLIIPYH